MFRIPETMLEITAHLVLVLAKLFRLLGVSLQMVTQFKLQQVHTQPSQYPAVKAVKHL
jgi:hypothetical protein